MRPNGISPGARPQHGSCRRQVAGQHVVVEWYKRDRWKRLIGVIRLDGEDMNLHLVERGLAWHYKRYADEQKPQG